MAELFAILILPFSFRYLQKQQLSVSLYLGILICENLCMVLFGPYVIAITKIFASRKDSILYQLINQ